MVSRRTILKASAIASGAAVFSGVVGGLNAFAAQNVRVRRSLQGMALDDPDLATYRDFVGMMLERDQNDPVSWLQYSLMHGSYETGLYRYCPHGDWYFLPWHRAYLQMYENAVIALTGNKNFAMPYWDWSVDRELPAAFTDPTYNGKPNPLYVANRTLTGPNWPLPDRWVSQEMLEKNVYAETNFQAFGTSRNPKQDSLDMSWVVLGGGAQGFLERLPHNQIHNAIGHYMPTAGSPRDPIFMMHHCNIDRIWARWNALGRSNTSGMTPKENSLWLDMNYKDNFLDPTGKPYSVKTRDVQDTSALGYTYPDLPKPDNLRADPKRDARLSALLAAGGAATKSDDHVLLQNKAAATPTKPLVTNARFANNLKTHVTPLGADASDSGEVFVIIRDMEVTPNVASVRVFVNSSAQPLAASDSNDHLAGEIGILAHPDSSGDAHGSHGAHHKAEPTAILEITDTLQKLANSGKLKTNDISIQLVPVLRQGAKDSQDAKVVPASIEIFML